jgi:hypothetical protein
LPINSENRKQPVAAAMDIHAIALPAVHAFPAMASASLPGRARYSRKIFSNHEPSTGNYKPNRKLRTKHRENRLSLRQDSQTGEVAMYDVGQEVTVITDKGVAYDGIILARATGENGSNAYKVALEGSGREQMGEWHKSGDVFVREKSDDETQDVWENPPAQ